MALESRLNVRIRVVFFEKLTVHYSKFRFTIILEELLRLVIAQIWLFSCVTTIHFKIVLNIRNNIL